MRPENRRREDRPNAGQPPSVAEIVRFPAQLDISNSGRCGSELLAAIQPGVTLVIADLSQTTFCDSSGVRHLLIGKNAAQHNGADLRVVVIAPAVLRVMNILGADRVLRLHGSMEDALSNHAASHLRQPEY